MTPNDNRAFAYPLLENTKRYFLHLRGKREAAGLAWLQEKSRTQRVMRQKAEMEMQIARGRLVDKEEAFEEWAPTFIALRHGFEELLSLGVSREVVDELLAILQQEPCTNGEGAANR